MSAEIQAMKVKAVAEKCGQSPRWVWSRLKNDPDFPKPFYASAHQPRWFKHEVDAWLELQASRRNAPRKIRFDRVVNKATTAS
jgi:predicted DNA-binding transcriptional regulator AlpA